MPSFVARDAFLLAPAIPFVRNAASAFSRSPPHSASPRLQSMMPALVCSLSCLTNCGSISVFVSISTFGIRHPAFLLGRNAGHLHRLPRARVRTSRHDCVHELLQHHTDRAD